MINNITQHSIIELRDHLDRALQDISKSRKEYIKAKYTFEWMHENKYLIPEELNHDLNTSMKKVEDLERKITKILLELDKEKI